MGESASPSLEGFCGRLGRQGAPAFASMRLRLSVTGLSWESRRDRLGIALQIPLQHLRSIRCNRQSPAPSVAYLVIVHQTSADREWSGRNVT